MKKIPFCFSLFIASVLLSACVPVSGSASAISKRYTLTPIASENIDNIPAVPFARIAVPAYIDTPKIVTRNTENVVSIHETRLWAESLARTIQRTIPILVAQNLRDKKLKNFEKVSVFVDRLDGELAGEVKISAQIVVSRLTETNVVSETFLFSHSVPAKQVNGVIYDITEDAYAAYAQAISVAVAELSKAVAANLAE